MILFDEPYVSDELAVYAQNTRIPVLDNPFARTLAERFDLNLLDDAAFAREAAAGRRLYTVSENALDWIYQNVKDDAIVRGIRLMKDKYALRKTIQPLYPDYMFRGIPATELRDTDVASLHFPFILKPSVGFFSMGVYAVTSEQDWWTALTDIERQVNTWKEHYPASVLGNTDFLLEDFIRGDEFAIDVYFDGKGQAVVLNIMRHAFTSDKDVSDRLYYTSKEIINTWLEPFTHFLHTVNALIGVRNFPAHIEVRVTEEGNIIPIECNPMRFSGWSTTDLTDFAFGLKTYDYYLNNRVPDWDALLTGKDEQLFAMAILEKPETVPANAAFDFDAVCKGFTEVLHV